MSTMDQLSIDQPVEAKQFKCLSIKKYTLIVGCLLNLTVKGAIIVFILLTVALFPFSRRGGKYPQWSQSQLPSLAQIALASIVVELFGLFGAKYKKAILLIIYFVFGVLELAVNLLLASHSLYFYRTLTDMTFSEYKPILSYFENPTFMVVRALFWHALVLWLVWDLCKIEKHFPQHV